MATALDDVHREANSAVSRRRSLERIGI